MDEQSIQARVAELNQQRALTLANLQALDGAIADCNWWLAKISDLQLVETMHYGVEAIARIYGVPLHLLQYPGGNTSFSSVEVIGIEWLRLGLGPLIANLESSFQRIVPGAEQTFLKFTLDGLLRATTQERYNSYATALNNGFLNINEVRALEDRAPIYIDDTAGLSIFELKVKLRKLVREKGVKMAVIDYVQLMTVGKGADVHSREQEISYISRNLKAIAKDLNIPVIALSQLSRKVEERADKIPQLSDLRESGSLEQDADLVMFIYRPEAYSIYEDDKGNTKGCPVRTAWN